MICIMFLIEVCDYLMFNKNAIFISLPQKLIT